MGLRIRKLVLYVFLIVFLMTRFAYLLPEFVAHPIVCPENFATALIIMWFVFVKFHSTRIKKAKLDCAWFVYGALLLVVTSSIQASRLYAGQSVIDGISTQKVFIAGILFFYIIDKYVKCNYISLDEIIGVILFCAVVHMGLYFVQYLLGPNHMMLSCYYTTPGMDSSVNRIRLYGSTSYIGFAYTVILSKLANEEKKMRSYLFIALAILFAVLINQGRSFIVQYIVLFALSMVLYKGNFTKRAVALSVFVVVIAVFLNSTYFNTLIDTIQNTTINTYSTLGVRYRSQEFYLNFLESHPILGGGYPDPSNTSAQALAGISSGYLVVDNGIYGLIFRYGILGLLWYFGCIITMLVKGIRIFKNTGNSMHLLKVSTFIMGYMTSVSAFDGFGVFYTGLYLVFAANMENKIQKN